MRKRIVGILVLVALLGLMWAIYQRDSPESSLKTQDTTSNSNADEQKTKEIDETADFANKPKLLIGSVDAKVTFVEYIDFKCPNCGKHHRDVGARLRSDYVKTGKMNIELRNYPFIGPDSGRAARGTYCANDQKILETYHDKVFDYMWDNYYSQNNYEAEFDDVLTTDRLVSLVKEVLVDEERFRSCVESTDYNRFIDADLLLGADDEINGTPGFVIGERSLVGPQGYTTFKTLIDIALR